MEFRRVSILIGHVAMFAVPSLVSAECLEYKIVDYGTSLEAVCVGTPLSDAEKKALEAERLIQEREIKYGKRDDKLERRDDQQYDQYLRRSEIGTEREEIKLEREKERLRRAQLNNDIIEDRHDDIAGKLDSMISGKGPTSKKAKKAKKAN